MRTKETHPSLRYHLMGVLLICVLSITVYSNTLNSPFVLDDAQNIQDNAFIRLAHLNFKKLYDAAFKSPASKRPVANITFALNYYFGRYEVTGYHVVNIIIHMINGILVYFLALSLFHQAGSISNQRTLELPDRTIPLVALFASLVFVAHPLQTQSVTYIVQRMNSLATLFYLLSLWLYIRARLTERRWQRWSLFSGCLLSWAMALGSKQIAVTLPFVVLLYEWYFVQDLSRPWLKRNIAYLFIPMVLLGVFAIIYLNGHPLARILGTYKTREFTLVERVWTQFSVVVFYISLLFFPHPSRLNLAHQFPVSHSLLEPVTTLFSLITIITLMGLAVCLAKKSRLISFSILWFLINLEIWARLFLDKKGTSDFTQ